MAPDFSNECHRRVGEQGHRSRPLGLHLPRPQAAARVRRLFCQNALSAGVRAGEEAPVAPTRHPPPRRPLRDQDAVSSTPWSDVNLTHARRRIPGRASALPGAARRRCSTASPASLPPPKGAIELDGNPVRGPGADRGVVFQKHALMPWLNVLDNVEFGLRMRGVAAAARREVAMEKLKLVGLEDFARRAIYELSGRHAAARGHRPRACVDPELMLMDEPLGALDAFTRESIQELILDVWQRSGKMVFFITHSVEEALFLATRPGRHDAAAGPDRARISRRLRPPLRGRRAMPGRSSRRRISSPCARRCSRPHPAARPASRRARQARADEQRRTKPAAPAPAEDVPVRHPGRGLEHGDQRG